VAIGNPDLRLTFDTNIRFRDYDLSLSKGNYGTAIIDKNIAILEIKSHGAMPLWLCKALEECEAKTTSFSKYGTAYKNFIFPNSLKLGHAGFIPVSKLTKTA
jgi:hypothetical protein